MTTPGSAAGSVPAPMNLVARYLGIVTSPKATFASIVAHPKWFGMLALTAVIVTVFVVLPLTTEAGRQAALDQQIESMKSMGFTVNDQMYEAMEKGASRMPYTTGLTILVLAPIFAVIISGLLFAIFNAALGGEAKFKQVLAVVAHAGAFMSGVVFSLSAILVGCINYVRGTAMTGVANLGAALPMLPERSFLASFLGAMDFFMIWYLVVLAIGLGVLYRRRTQPIAITLLTIYALIAIVIALVKSRAGGA
jgi:hypothetical protein